MSVVISDTSPIRALHHLGLLHVLESLYGKVIVPTAVAAELLQVSRRFSKFDVNTYHFLEMRSPIDVARVKSLEIDLDMGEAAALVLALECNADYVLMDERRGRIIARKLGLTVIGVLGILSQAKQRQLIPAIRPLLDTLKRELDFHLKPDLVAEVLRQAGE